MRHFIFCVWPRLFLCLCISSCVLQNETPFSQCGLGQECENTCTGNACLSGSGQVMKLNSNVLRGMVSRVTQAHIQVYRLASDLSRMALLGEGWSDANGFFDVAVSDVDVTWVEVVSTGGVFTDAVTRQSVTWNHVEVFSSIVAMPNTFTLLSPLTTLKTERLRALFQKAQTLSDNASTLPLTIDLSRFYIRAQRDVSYVFLLENVNLDTTIPADLNVSSSAQNTDAEILYGAVLAGISQYLYDHSIATSFFPDLMLVLKQDIQDGDLDGRDANGNTVEDPFDISQLQDNFETTILRFLSSPNNQSGVRFLDDLVPNNAEGVDTDNDGVTDANDACPNDPNDWQDTDGDGVCDHADACPNDVFETQDTDHDGVCDGQDQCVDDPTQVLDVDGVVDGVCHRALSELETQFSEDCSALQGVFIQFELYRSESLLQTAQIDFMFASDDAILDREQDDTLGRTMFLACVQPGFGFAQVQGIEADTLFRVLLMPDQTSLLSAQGSQIVSVNVQSNVSNAPNCSDVHQACFAAGDSLFFEVSGSDGSGKADVCTCLGTPGHVIRNVFDTDALLALPAIYDAYGNVSTVLVQLDESDNTQEAYDIQLGHAVLLNATLHLLDIPLSYQILGYQVRVYVNDLGAVPGEHTFEVEADTAEQRTLNAGETVFILNDQHAASVQINLNDDTLGLWAVQLVSGGS